MVDHTLDGVFHALAHGVRRDMVARLAAGDHTVSELAEPFGISLAASSKHIAVLERAGLLHRTVLGRRHVCRLDAAPLAGAEEWVAATTRFWTGRLDALAVALDSAPAERP